MNDISILRLEYNISSRYKGQLHICDCNRNVTYHCDVIPTSCKNGGGKIRNVMLSQNDFKILIKSTSNQNLKKALTLSYHFGLRAAECAKLKFEDIKSNGISIYKSMI